MIGQAALATARPALEVRPYGDSAVIVTARGGTAEERWETVHQLASALYSQQLRGIDDAIATYDSLLIEFDSGLTGFDHIERWADGWDHAGPGLTPRRQRFVVPTVYGGEYGPDLEEVAAQLGLTADQVVTLHSGVDWVVRFLGAPAGAPMIDGSPLPSAVSRCPEPRTHVPAGSVAVAGLQGVVYPVRSPGGWRLVGRTPSRLVDLTRRPIVPYQPGDLVRFSPIAPDQWADFQGNLEPVDG